MVGKAQTEKPKCQHCGQFNINRPRKLCFKCYYTPGIKELYPSTSKYTPRRRDNTIQCFACPARVNPMHMKRNGWRSQFFEGGNGKEKENFCKECFAKWGFPPPGPAVIADKFRLRFCRR
jgi:hypothetical protein